jgi:hypothetical protein
MGRQLAHGGRMTTWEENLARTDRSWLVYATIQGIGDSAGLWRFANTTGWTLTAGQGTWKPYLREPPSLLSTRVPYVNGGVTEDEGGVLLSVVDIGEQLTQLLRVDAPAVAQLTTNETANATLLNVTSGHGFSDGDIVWLGSEAVTVTNAAASVLTVTRASLGTAATPHAAGSAVYAHPNVLRNREVRVYLAPADGDEDGSRLVGVYTLDSVSFNDEHTTWQFEGGLREPYLDRRCPRAPYTFEADRVLWTNNEQREGFRGWYVEDLSDLDTLPLFADPLFRTADVVKADGDYGSEVRRLVVSFLGPGFKIVSVRGVAGSEEEDAEPGTHAVVMSVPNGDFRISTNPGSTAGRTTSWTPSDHVVDILLCILTSSAIPEDGLQFVNIFDDPADLNASGLPVGYGIGVPVDRIDLASFLDVRQRMPDARLPNFVLGPESQTFRKVATEQLLEPFGIILTNESGKLVLRLPRLPTNDEAGEVTVNTSNVLARSAGRNNYQPRVEISRDLSNVATSVKYTLGRVERDLTVGWADFPRLFDPLDLYEFEGESAEVNVPGADPNRDKVFRDTAKRKLWQTFRPPTLLKMDVDASLWEWRLTTKADVTIPGVVNPTSGVRGFVNASAQLVEREEVMSLERGVHLAVTAHLTPSLRAGRISASADVVSFDGEGPVVVQVEPNRYTAPDAVGLPTNDAEAFAVDDVVRLVDSAGNDIGGTTQVVTAVGSGELTLDGTFGGNLATDATIVYADADESTTTQRGRYVYMGGLSSFNISGTADPLWQYGTP